MSKFICNSCGEEFGSELAINTSEFKTGYKTYRFCTECTTKIKERFVNNSFNAV